MLGNLKETVANITMDSISATLSYIQANGVMVSNRWRIGEETGSNGHLRIRDEISSIVYGVDSRYDLTPMISKNL